MSNNTTEVTFAPTTTLAPTSYAPTTVSSRNPFDVSGVEWPEILSTLQVNGLICVFLLVLFEWKRGKHRRIYSPKEQDGFEEEPRRPLAWFGWTVRLSDEELRAAIGLDAFLLLRFTRMWKKIFFWSAVLGCLVLLPIYASGLRQQTGFYRLTMRNLKKGQKRLWAPFCFMYCFTAFILRGLEKEARNYLMWRREFLGGSLDTKPAQRYQSQCSVHVERIPMHLRTETLLHQYFATLVGAENMFSAIIFLDLRELDNKLRARDIAARRFLRGLEKKDKVTTACGCWSQSHTAEAVSTFAKQLDDANQDFLNARDRALASERYLASRSAPVLGESTTDPQERSSYFFDSSPLEWVSRQIFMPSAQDQTEEKSQEEEGASSYDALLGHQGFLRQTHAVSKRILEQTSATTVDVLRQAGDLTSDLTTTTIEGLATTLALDSVATKYYAASSSGIITFTNPGIAADVAQLKLTSQPLGIEASGPAAPPSDIVWTNITKSADKIETRTLLADCWLWVCALGWTPLIAALQTLANLDEMARLFPFLKPYVREDRYEYPRSIVTGLLPVALLLGLLALVPILLERLARSYVGLKTYSSIQRFVLSRYFYFQLLSTFVTILAGSVSSTLKAFVSHPNSLLQLLGKSLPTISAYFMQTLCVKILFSLGWELARPIPYLLATAKDKLDTYVLRRETSSHTNQDETSIAPEFRIGQTGPEFLMVVLIGTTYAPIAPLILCIATIFFFFADAVFTRQFLFVYINKFESGGIHLWPALTYFSILALVASQLTTLSYLTLLGGVRQAPLLIPLPIITILFYQSRLVRFYEKPAVHLDRETAIKNSLRDPDHPMKSHLRPDLYRHPALVTQSQDAKSILASIEAHNNALLLPLAAAADGTANPLVNNAAPEDSDAYNALAASGPPPTPDSALFSDEAVDSDIEADEKVSSP